MRNSKFLPVLFNERDTFVSSFDHLFDRLMKTSFPDISKEIGIDFFEKASYPKCNIFRKDGALVIEAAVPGVTKEDLSIKFDAETSDLTISSCKQDSEETNEIIYFYRELKKSSFKRTFRFGDAKKYDLEHLNAKLDNGILTLTINELEPKKIEESKIKEIAIN